MIGKNVGRIVFGIWLLFLVESAHCYYEDYEQTTEPEYNTYNYPGSNSGDYPTGDRNTVSRYSNGENKNNCYPGKMDVTDVLSSNCNCVAFTSGANRAAPQSTPGPQGPRGIRGPPGPPGPPGVNDYQIRQICTSVIKDMSNGNYADSIKPSSSSSYNDHDNWY